jgi:hypothetical protein
MAFKKSLAAVFFALPFILGINLFFREKIDVLIIVAASPTKRHGSCNFLEPIKADLIENLFDNECGDGVSLLSLYYEHLSEDCKGSWCSTSRFP